MCVWRGQKFEFSSTIYDIRPERIASSNFLFNTPFLPCPGAKSLITFLIQWHMIPWIHSFTFIFFFFVYVIHNVFCTSLLFRWQSITAVFCFQPQTQKMTNPTSSSLLIFAQLLEMTWDTVCRDFLFFLFLFYCGRCFPCCHNCFEAHLRAENYNS